MGASAVVLLMMVSPLVMARVDIVPAVLVHEEHFPPIGREPTYTLARFVAELLKMQGDEIYANAIPKSRPLSKSKPSFFKPTNYNSNNQQRQKQPYQNVRINNSFRQQRANNIWPTYTQVIFSPVRAERLIDISTSATQNVAKSDNIDRSSITTATAPKERSSTVTAASLVDEALIARSIDVSASPQISSTTGFFSSTSANSPTTTTTTTDIIDVIRKELKAQKPSPRPFIRLGKIFKKRNTEWKLVNPASSAKKSTFGEKEP